MRCGCGLSFGLWVGLLVVAGLLVVGWAACYRLWLVGFTGCERPPTLSWFRSHDVASLSKDIGDGMKEK